MKVFSCTESKEGVDASTQVSLSLRMLSTVYDGGMRKGVLAVLGMAVCMTRRR